MFESPRSLQEFCIDYICSNILGFCDFHLGDTNVHSPTAPNNNTVPGKCCVQFVCVR